MDKIANDLDLAPKHVSNIIEELEKNKFFLFRNKQGDVEWAYPVTTEKTPHKAYLPGNKKIYAA